MLFRVPLFEGARWKVDADLNEDAIVAVASEVKHEKSTLTQADFFATRLHVDGIINRELNTSTGKKSFV